MDLINIQFVGFLLFIVLETQTQLPEPIDSPPMTLLEECGGRKDAVVSR